MGINIANPTTLRRKDKSAHADGSQRLPNSQAAPHFLTLQGSPWQNDRRSMPAPRVPFWRSMSRRLLAVGVLFAYLAAVFGLPLPPPVVIKDGGKLFPCQGHACGCLTAEDCWRHCCCHTPEERWAWAKENRVQPPEYAEKPGAAHADLCDSTEPRHAGECPCCKGKGARRDLDSTPLGGRAVSPLRCQGLTTQWVTTGVVPTEPPAYACPLEPPATERLLSADFSAHRVTLSPPSRPPRLPIAA